MEEERAKLETQLAMWKRSLGLEIVSTKYDLDIVTTPSSSCQKNKIGL